MSIDCTMGAMRTPGVLLLALLCGCSLHAAEGPRAPGKTAPARNAPAALLLVEYGEDAAGEQLQTLKRYRFRNGRLASTEAILTTRTLDVRYDLNENRMVGDRFVITHWGDVVDTRKKAVLHRGGGAQVRGLEGDLVVLEVDKDAVHGFFTYDLATQRYGPLAESGRWKLPGLVSPDRKRSVDPSRGGQLWLHTPAGERRLLGDDFRAEGGFDCSSTAQTPALWLDDDRIVTQQGNGHIVVVDVATAAVTPLMEVPVEAVEHGCGPDFRRDREGGLLYSGAGDTVLLDAARKTYAPYRWMRLGHGFAAEETRNASYGSILRHGEKEIGRLWASTANARTTDGYLAVEVGAVGSNLGYPAGVKVWSEVTRRWTAITPKWHGAILGWEEPRRTP